MSKFKIQMANGGGQNTRTGTILYRGLPFAILLVLSAVIGRWSSVLIITDTKHEL